MLAAAMSARAGGKGVWTHRHVWRRPRPAPRPAMGVTCLLQG